MRIVVNLRKTVDGFVLKVEKKGSKKEVEKKRLGYEFENRLKEKKDI